MDEIEIIPLRAAALSFAIGKYSSDTGEHSERVAVLATRVGEALELTDEEISALHWATLLHDLGKIACPLEILAKPGPLTPAEWIEVKRHPQIGADMIAVTSNKLELIASAIRGHHERPDGLGYPSGLAGYNIPPLARIVKVVDTYDAMTSNRTYAPKLSPAEAREILLEGRGREWDRVVVDLFCSTLNDESAA